ncbi:hypothetical protein K8M07_07600 [Schnuerera sp. xch1]|uniref:hypothetical protein n=1 Tax=Schnuerera sp. xch1 TaxID=2874283 RepID=UPI001CBAD48F|nr:hypothetical protein [Schnuerera sp. xch1]MBZ2175118.1 hypothetical protein [Schnuerera sp. xch1]
MDIAQYLYINPTLDLKNNRITIDANGILISDDHYGEIDKLISFRNSRDYLLNIQIENLEKRKELYKKLKIPYKNIGNISSLESHLDRYLDEIDDLTVDIDIKKSFGNRLNLTFSFPRNKTYKWYRLHRKDVEDYIWNVYSAILILYNEDVSIRGEIENPYYSKNSSSSNRNYVTFTTEDNDLDFDFSRSKLRRDYRIDADYLADMFNKELDKYSNYEFKYEADQSGYNVDLYIEVDSKNFFNKSIYKKIGYLRKLNYEIRRVNPNVSIDGVIYYDDNDTIEFNIEDNIIRSVDLLTETENYLDRLYGDFSYRRYDFELEYNIYETDKDELKLVVQTDFSITDDEWIEAGDTGENRLNNEVKDAIDYIEDIWDMDVTVEIVDENMTPITF